MGVEYTLVNESKREFIGFSHMDGNKARELAGNPAQSAVVTWYMLENQGDSIQFVSDAYDDWPFKSSCRSDLSEYQDVTMKYIGKLIELGVLVNEGMLYLDEDDPENIYILNLKNVWQKNA
jgi:hypothetical protein